MTSIQSFVHDSFLLLVTRKLLENVGDMYYIHDTNHTTYIYMSVAFSTLQPHNGVSSIDKGFKCTNTNISTLYV